MKKILSQLGLSMVEGLIGAGVMGGLSLVAVNLFEGQTKNQAAIELMMKKEQLRISVINQMLKESENCGCLFPGATFSTSGTTSLTSSVNALGRYAFSTPGDCGTATIPLPLISTAGVDGLHLEYVRLLNVAPASGTYVGELNIGMSTKKKVTGTKVKDLRIPVMISTSPAGAGQVSLDGCALDSVVSPKSPVGWIQTFKNPTFPLTINVPSGTKGLLVTVNATQYKSLPADKGESVGSRYTYTTDISATPQTFAELSIGAGNNNGAQARITAATQGLIDIGIETTVTINKLIYVLNSSGGQVCLASTCGGVFYGPNLITVQGIE